MVVASKAVPATVTPLTRTVTPPPSGAPCTTTAPVTPPGFQAIGTCGAWATTPCSTGKGAEVPSWNPWRFTWSV